MNGQLNDLQTEDIYSLILFALYKMKDIPEYSTLSELAYILDRKSLLNLLEYYGGMTIKIPTVSDFTLIINALLLYQYINLEHVDFEKALRALDKPDAELRDITDAYLSMCKILNTYDFRRK